MSRRKPKRRKPKRRHQPNAEQLIREICEEAVQRGLTWDEAMEVVREVSQRGGAVGFALSDALAERIAAKERALSLEGGAPRDT